MAKQHAHPALSLPRYPSRMYWYAGLTDAGGESGLTAAGPLAGQNHADKIVDISATANTPAFRVVPSKCASKVIVALIGLCKCRIYMCRKTRASHLC